MTTSYKRRVDSVFETYCSCGHRVSYHRQARKRTLANGAQVYEYAQCDKTWVEQQARGRHPDYNLHVGCDCKGGMSVIKYP